MEHFTNDQGTRIYFSISTEINKVFDALLKYNDQDKRDLFIEDWMYKYDQNANYEVPNLETTTIYLDISDCDEKKREEILAIGKYLIKQDSFFEFMARKYCVETLKKLNNIFSITVNNRINTNTEIKKKHMSQTERDFHTFLIDQQKLSILTANAYISTVRLIKREYDIDLCLFTNIKDSQELSHKFTSDGQYYDFNTKRHGAPHAVTEAYIEYLQWINR